MFIIHVQIQVKPENIEAFKTATLANARASRQEPGVARFDVMQQLDDPAHFVLVEVYRNAAAQVAHRETKHYPIWRDTVADMMAEPRTSVKFNNVFPEGPKLVSTRFEFATAGRIVFGAGAISLIDANVKKLGRRALVVTGRDPGRAGKLLGNLTAAGISATTFPVSGEPEIGTVERGTVLARNEQCDFVIGFGGGSVLDAAKAIAAMLTNEGALLDYLEIIGKGQALTKRPAPFVAIPTTAGTGSEVTRNAVLASPEHKVKVSLRSPLMLARHAIVDPELTYDLPPALTASTGLDALTQLIEPYTCLRANPMTDSYCEDGIQRVARSLGLAVANGSNHAAREGMAMASLFGGLALANAGLGAVHGFAGPIGGAFTAPHGAVCAALLPHAMAANIKAMRERSPKNFALGRYYRIAILLTGNQHATADAGVEWVSRFIADLPVLKLRDYGIRKEHFPDLVTKAANASSMKANPIELTPAELTEILHQAT